MNENYDDYEDIIEEERPIAPKQEVEGIPFAEEHFLNTPVLEEEGVKLDAKEEDIEEIDLPTIVRNWEKVATSYSRYNNIPAVIGFYTLLGDLVKNMVEIPFGPTTTDTRIHFCWIQTARTGKTTLIMYVLNPVAKEIFKAIKKI